MKTTKPISTVSYNSPDYLALKLEALRKAKIISFWAFMHHLGEPSDEVPDAKDHNHIYIELARSVQTEDLKEELREPDPSKPGKMLGCMTFNKSQFGDWCLYALHDPEYLESKSLTKLNTYKLEEMRSSDPDELLYKYRMIDRSDRTPIRKIKEAMKAGLQFPEMVSKGIIPVAQLPQYEKAYKHLLRSKAIEEKKEMQALVKDMQSKGFPVQLGVDEHGKDKIIGDTFVPLTLPGSNGQKSI